MPEEDAILPDDYEAPPQAEETQEIELESEVETTVEDTTKTEEPTEEVTAPKVKVKFNHEEKEISLEEAAVLAQKGMNYEKGIERARQEARDAMVAERGETWNGKPVTTEAEYMNAIAEKELMEKYQDRDLPEEVIQELMASRRDREERAKEKVDAAEQAQRNAHLDEFLEYFQQSNGRLYDPVKDAFPKDLKDAIDNGVPLLKAYMSHEAKELRNQVKVFKQNEQNTKRAPIGSVSSHGSNEVAAEDAFMRGFNSV